MQFDLFDSESDTKKKAKEDYGQLSLPVSPLQEKQLEDEPTLTDCEFEIMQMVLSGFSIYEMAIKVFLSIAGVKYRLTNIYAKFGAHNRLGLIKKTSSSGIQFKTRHGIRHTFHNNVNLRAHEKDKHENNRST